MSCFQQCKIVDAGVKEQADYGSESDWVEEYYA